MMNDKLNSDVDLDWRIKERSMSQTVDLQENNSILLNNIKYMYDSNTNRSRMRVQQMRKMQVSRGSISSGLDIEDNVELPVMIDSEIENQDNLENKMINIKSIKGETTTSHIKNKTIDMTSPDFKFENGNNLKTPTNTKNTTISISNVNMVNNINNPAIINDTFEEKEYTSSTLPKSYNLPVQIKVVTDLNKVDSEQNLNGNLSTAPHLTTPLITNENAPISTKIQTTINNEDTEVVVSDLEGSIDNVGDDTNDDYLFSLSCSQSHKSFIPITNSLKSKKDIKEENATPSYLLALSQCANSHAEDESDEIQKNYVEMGRLNNNLNSYENLDSLENESLRSSQGRFSYDRNKNNVYKYLKDMKHVRLPSGKNYFINSIIEEEFSEICSDTEISFKKHSYHFSKGKIDASSEKILSLQASKEMQVEKNLENVFFNKMKNNHSNSKSEIPSDLNNNLKKGADLIFNPNNPKNSIKEKKIDKNEIFNIQIDLKKNFDELKKKVIEDEQRNKAKVENKKKEIIDLFYNKVKNANRNEANSNTGSNKNISEYINKRQVQTINNILHENTKKTTNKIIINLNTIDGNKISPRSPSPPIKDKKSPSSRCREEYYQDSSDRSKKHKKFEDMAESLPKLSKEDFDMKIFSPQKKELIEPIIDPVIDPCLTTREEKIDTKQHLIVNNYPNNSSNHTAANLSHKAMKEIYKRQREQKSKNSSIFKSEDLRISKPEAITLQTPQIDSNRIIQTNTFNSINEQYSFININNNINICTPLSMKNDIVEYGTVTERANDKILTNALDSVKNNMSTINELCQASPISFINNQSNRKSMNFNFNFSSKQENINLEQPDGRNIKDNYFKKLLFECDINKSENLENLENVEKISGIHGITEIIGKKKYEDEKMSVSNEITINIINLKPKIVERMELKEIVGNVKIEENDKQNRNILVEDNVKPKLYNNKKENLSEIIKTFDNVEKTQKIQKIEKSDKNNILKVSMGEILKREPIIQHKKHVSLNPKAFLNQEYKLNNLLANNKPNNDNNKVKSNSIGKNTTNKQELNTILIPNNHINNNFITKPQPHIIKDKEHKSNATYLTNIQEARHPTKMNLINNFPKNKSRSSSDSSVKFNHLEELLSKQHSILNAPNPIMINYNPNTKKLEKKLNLAALSSLEKNKMTLGNLPIQVNQMTNTRNLSHDVKSNNLSTNSEKIGTNMNNSGNVSNLSNSGNGANTIKPDLKKLLMNPNKNNFMNMNNLQMNMYHSNNSNIESVYSSVGNNSNSGISNKTTVEKIKNNPINQKMQSAVVPIPKMPNSKKNLPISSYKTVNNVTSTPNIMLNQEEMLRLYDKIKNIQVDKISGIRNDSKSKWK